MREYIAVHAKRGTVEVEAESSYKAQLKACELLKVKPNKSYEVSVYLADVVHNPSILGA